MTGFVFFTVICAALFHACWNALVKSGDDKWLNMTGIVMGHIPIAILCLFFVPVPNIAAFPYFLASIIFHTGYQVFLLNAYRMGDFTQVYPIARGSAPLIVALISMGFLGVVLLPLHILAIVLIAAGIISIAFTRKADGLRNPKAGGMALMTGIFIASYSLTDGMGARAAETSLGYYAWLAIANAFVFGIYLALKRRQVLLDLPRKGKKVFWLGGTASFIAYALVTWAFTQAPIALVTALRETSIFFALFIGVFVLKEPLNLTKVFSTMMTMIGVLLIKLVR